MRRRILFVISLTTLLVRNSITHLFRNKSTNYNMRENSYTLVNSNRKHFRRYHDLSHGDHP